VFLYVKGRVLINPGGGITANGTDGSLYSSGGGGGGLIVIASPLSITSNGLLAVHGGKGSNAQVGGNFIGASGGGGGGLIHLISPSITQGNVDVSGGDAGTSVVSSPFTAAYLGGAGGGSFGDGGQAANLDARTSPLNSDSRAIEGKRGDAVQTIADPGPML
jgi:hypothetical protein